MRTLFDYQRHGLFQCLLRASRNLLGRSKRLRFVHIFIQAKQKFLNLYQAIHCNKYMHSYISDIRNVTNFRVFKSISCVFWGKR